MTGPATPGDLSPGTVYDWDALGRAFGFKPSYLSAAGGMPVSTATDSVLLITHPGGGKSFDYADYWDGADLVYKGRGQEGDQKRTGPNLDVAENRRRLFVFEADAPKHLRFLGQARCVDEWTVEERDRNDALRSVLFFRLRFSDDGGIAHATPADVPAARKAPAPGRPTKPATRAASPRRFDSTARPAEAELAEGSVGTDLAETHALREQARQDHHDLVSAWADFLTRAGWTEIVEIPGGFDLRAVSSQARVVFEMKTISETNELSQCRSALAQLLEYRLRLGTATDILCLVTNTPVTAERAAILDALGVAVVAQDGDLWVANNERGLMIVSLPVDGATEVKARFDAAQRRLESVRKILARHAEAMSS